MCERLFSQQVELKRVLVNFLLHGDAMFDFQRSIKASHDVCHGIWVGTHRMWVTVVLLHRSSVSYWVCNELKMKAVCSVWLLDLVEELHSRFWFGY